MSYNGLKLTKMSLRCQFSPDKPLSGENALLRITLAQGRHKISLSNLARLIHSCRRLGFFLLQQGRAEVGKQAQILSGRTMKEDCMALVLCISLGVQSCKQSRCKKSMQQESFIVISTLCVCCASPAACCWCRVSCCLFLMRKMFYLLKYNQSRIAQARHKQVEENQDQSMKGCSVNSERCKNIHRNCNSGHIGLHIHKDS